MRTTEEAHILGAALGVLDARPKLAADNFLPEEKRHRKSRPCPTRGTEFSGPEAAPFEREDVTNSEFLR